MLNITVNYLDGTELRVYGNPRTLDSFVEALNVAMHGDEPIIGIIGSKVSLMVRPELIHHIWIDEYDVETGIKNA